MGFSGQEYWSRWPWFPPGELPNPGTKHMSLTSYTGLGRQTLGGPGDFGRDVDRLWPATGLGPLNVAVHAWDILKEVPIIFITSTIVWPQVNNREGTQPHPLTQNWVKDLLSMALPIRTRPNFPLSQILPSGSFHKPLILLHQRADRLKATTTEN